jgi:hypothetical protein
MEVVRNRKKGEQKTKNPEARAGSGFYFTRQLMSVRTLSTAEAAGKQQQAKQ